MKEKDHGLIQKWRIISMLLYLKNMVEQEKPSNEIISVINNYIKFSEEIKEEIYGR